MQDKMRKIGLFLVALLLLMQHRVMAFVNAVTSKGKLYTDEPPGIHKEGYHERFQATIFHEKGEEKILIRAYLYAARNHPQERQQLDAALHFWNSQSERFAYRVGKKGKEKYYPIVFDLMEAPGYYNENGFFLPEPDVSEGLLIPIEIVPDKAMKKLQKLMDNESPIVGYASDKIYISANYSDLMEIGLHETGHKLGAGHSEEGVMAHAVDLIHMSVHKQNIREILRVAGLAARPKEVKEGFGIDAPNVTVMHDGKIPKHFFKFGKVVKWKGSTRRKKEVAHF